MRLLKTTRNTFDPVNSLFVVVVVRDRRVARASWQRDCSTSLDDIASHLISLVHPSLSNRFSPLPTAMERRTRSQGFLIFATVAVSLFLIMKFFSSSTSSSPPTAPDKPDETGFRQRIVAFGDLHGDIVNAKKVLRMARIIDEHERWCAGSTILVQTVSRANCLCSASLTFSCRETLSTAAIMRCRSTASCSGCAARRRRRVAR